jgi:anti-sigma factor RsiW
LAVTCQEFTDLILDYESGEMTSESRAIFEQHLERCEQCQNYLTLYRASVKLGKQAFDDDAEGVREDIPDDLVKAIRAARAARAARDARRVH